MNWYQVKATYERVDDSKKVSELFLVQAPTFGIAEEAIRREVASLTNGESDIVAISRKNYNEILADKFNTLSEIDGKARQLMGQSGASTEADKWFKCKVSITTLDEKKGVEKKTPVLFLVNASNAMVAHKLVDVHMRGSMSDYDVECVDDTKIVDVFKATLEL